MHDYQHIDDCDCDCGDSCHETAAEAAAAAARLREARLCARLGRCVHLLTEPGPNTIPVIADLYYCGQRAGERTRLACPAGRPDAEAGPYCAEHGGLERSQREAEADWMYAAPESVGDEEAVLVAGAASLSSEHAILVLREEQPEQRPEMWRISLTRDQHVALRAVLGDDAHPKLKTWGLLGPRETRDRSLVDELHAEVCRWIGMPPRVEHLPSRVVPRKRPWLAQLGVGSHIHQVGAFATRDEALAAGRAAWRENVDRTIKEINLARGGTLSWGMPVVPAQEPVVVEARPGECSWDAYARTVKP